MPDLALGLTLGESDANIGVGPIGGPIAPTIDGAYLLENGTDFLLNESGSHYLAFEINQTALWTPRRMSTVGWWDPSDSSTITTSSSEVTSVTDKSGNGYTLAPLTTNRRPTIGTTTQNGLNVFEYSNTIPNLQVLENNSFSWNQSNTEIAFAMVFRCNDEGTLDQDFYYQGLKHKIQE